MYAKYPDPLPQSIFLTFQSLTAPTLCIIFSCLCYSEQLACYAPSEYWVFLMEQYQSEKDIELIFQHFQHFWVVWVCWWTYFCDPFCFDMLPSLLQAWFLISTLLTQEMMLQVERKNQEYSSYYRIDDKLNRFTFSLN